MIRRTLFPLAVAALLSEPLAAQQVVIADTAARSLRAERREGPIVLDGRLVDPAWDRAAVASGFTQAYPDPGTLAPDQTEVRVLYDDEALYVGVRMFDRRPDSIAAQLARRDAGGIYSDWVHVLIDSYHDRRTAFRFSVNPRGVLKDVFHFDDDNEDVNWDAVFEAAARVDSAGWVAEFRIPFSQLRFGTAVGPVDRVWGFQVMRDIARRSQVDVFSPWTPEGRGVVSRFGDLTGLAGIPVPSRLELLPYVSARATRAPGDAADPFFEDTDVEPSVGADVRWGMPGGLTLTATVNPDFGQVEVDPAVVNLSAFETFFEEKRPFFLEGSDIFEFGRVRRNNDYNSQTFLYSRRIGRAPQRDARGDGIAYVDQPEQTTILGAAKVTGKIGGWTIGILDAVTDEERARVDSAGAGGIHRTPVEPMTNYFAGRMRRDLRRGRTVLGAMLTHVGRDLDVGGPDPDLFRSFLPTNAAFGGIDFEHSWHDRSWTVSGFTAFSRVAGSADAIGRLQQSPARYYQRPDADHVDLDPDATSLTGHFSELALSRSGRWLGSVAVKNASPGFEINDFGFHGRMDYRSYSDLIGYQHFESGRFLRERSVIVYQNHAWNTDGDAIFHSFAGQMNGAFVNFWNAGISAGFRPESYNDRLTRGGPLSLNPTGWHVSGNLGTDSRKAVVVGAYAEYSRDRGGAVNRYTEVEVEMRPTSSLSVEIEPGVFIGRGQTQYVRRVSDPTAAATYGARYVFADIDQVEVSMETRVEWTLTPALSVQAFVQPFVSTGRFDRYKELERPGSFEFAVYGEDRGTIRRNANFRRYTVDPDGPGGAPEFTFGDPTFNVRSLRGNAVLRWEYRPGSTIFVVWQQGRQAFAPIGDYDAARDFRALVETVPTNVLLVKATYWFNR